MSSVYCWFDWEDDTTTVNSINVIQEPRKPWNEYEVGEKIIAKLPKYGTWGGVIVEISDSKEDLVRHMNDRQQFPVYTDFKAVGGNVGITGVSLDSSSGTKRKSKKAELSMNEEKLADSGQSATGNDDSSSTGSAHGSRMQKKKTKKSGNAKNDEKTVDFETDDDGSECDDQSSRPKKKLKKTEKTKNEEKAVDTENQKKSREEKQKKKDLEKVRLETKTKEYEDIISQRRTVSDESATGGQVGSVENEKPIQHHLEANVDNTYPNAMQPGNSSYYYEQGLQNVPQTYSYVQDLGETDIQFGTSSFRSLLSYQELLDQNQDLEAENYNLKQEVKELKERLDSRSPQQSSLPDLEVTPRKIEFFKRLTRTLEISQKGSSSKQLFQHTVTTSTHSTPIRNVVSPSHTTPPPPAIYNDNTPVRNNGPTTTIRQNTPVSSPSTPLNSRLIENQSEPTFHWEDNATSAGQKKIQLVSNIACYVTQGQLSHALHVGNQPRKLVIALLDTLFTREQLAQSSSTGTRSAVNSTCKTAALPSNAVKAIKTFVLNQYKNENGVPCLSDAMFNTVINSKCATARRSLK